MKKNIGKDFLKKAAAGLIALTLALSGASLLPGTDSKVYASEAGTETYYQEYFAEISAYTGDERTAPKPTDAGHRDWLFAGWFTDEACENTCTATEGAAYAKFVPAGVLSVKCQILAETTKESPSDQLRIVSTVDSLAYSQVGFDITINEISRSYSSTKVYETINAKEGGVVFEYTPGQFHEKAKYFITGTLINIPSDEISTGIQITPWWKTLDGTKVCGVGTYARVSDAYDNIYNIPIRLYSDEEVAAGYLEVSYDKEVFQYIGMDEGSVFDEMEVRGADGIVRCVGNKRVITATEGNVKADGMYVNLRFQLVEGKSVPVGETEFTVSAEDFCDNQEAEKETYVPDGVYKMIGE